MATSLWSLTIWPQPSPMRWCDACPGSVAANFHQPDRSIPRPEVCCIMSTNPRHVDPELPDVPDVPDVDERLVAPGARYEVYDGELVHVPPADELHGTRHSKVVTLVEIHTGPAFDVACDMLTRTSETGD